MLNRESLKGALLVSFGMLIAACASRMMPAQEASASAAKVCDYTYISDLGSPEIGENGTVQYSEDWSRLLNAGWKLHGTGQADTGVYIFEKCTH